MSTSTYIRSTPGLMFNKYLRNCRSCNCEVKPGKGFYHGKGKVYCSDCSLDAMIDDAEVKSEEYPTHESFSFLYDEDADINPNHLNMEYND